MREAGAYKTPYWALYNRPKLSLVRGLQHVKKLRSRRTVTRSVTNGPISLEAPSVTLNHGERITAIGITFSYLSRNDLRP